MTLTPRSTRKLTSRLSRKLQTFRTLEDGCNAIPDSKQSVNVASKRGTRMSAE